MAIVDLVMPKLGESIMEATILRWHKHPGDQVRLDETVVDIATDKVDSEVPSDTEGTMEEILFAENDVVPIGAVIARIRTSATTDQEQMQPGPPDAPGVHNGRVQEIIHDGNVGRQQNAAPPKADYANTLSPNSSERAQNTTQRFYSPLVLNIAARENISMNELESLPGTGSDGRVTKKDILQFIEDRSSFSGEQQTGLADRRQTLKPDVAVLHDKTADKETRKDVLVRPYPESANLGIQQGNVEIIEMDRMRKMIARHMLDSVQTSPHVTSFSEADVTNMVLWREKIKKDFQKRENEKITFTPLFVEAVIRCIKKYPWLNSSLDGDRLLVKKDINIGMATALPSGNLIVPVIKNADQLNLVGLTRQVNRLAADARNNKLKPDDTAGGTFTITNIGSFGSIMGTPIINQPQVAILALGAIKKKPVVIETAQGDSIAIRHMMYLSMSYDHRIIDGALGSTFLNAVARELENFDGNREY